MAKDVSALANSEGGFLIVGLKTRKDTNKRQDIVQTVHAFDKALYDQDKLFRTIEQWVFPWIQNLEIEWYDKGRGKGIFSIAVPAKEQSSKPYLVTQHIDSDDNIYGSVVGIFERRRDSVSHRTAQGIHSLLSFAENTFEIANRLDSIESLLRKRNILDKKQSEEKFLERIDSVVDNRIKQCIKAAELQEKAFLSIACFPLRQIDIPGLFRGANDPVVKLIEQTPKYRNGGWDLSTYNPSRLIGGLLRRSSEPGLFSLDVWKDGIIIAVVSAGKDYLSWVRYTSDGEIPRIHPITLIEAISLFSKLAKGGILTLAVPQELRANFRISFENIVQNDKTYQLERVVGVVGIFKKAPESSVVIDVPIEKLDEDDNEIAFKVFSPIFGWFDIDHNHIPFVKIRENGVYVFDEDSLRNIPG